jgi:hypothetical protein
MPIVREAGLGLMPLAGIAAEEGGGARQCVLLAKGLGDQRPDNGARAITKLKHATEMIDRCKQHNRRGVDITHEGERPITHPDMLGDSAGHGVDLGKELACEIVDVAAGDTAGDADCEALQPVMGIGAKDGGSLVGLRQAACPVIGVGEGRGAAHLLRDRARAIMGEGAFELRLYNSAQPRNFKHPLVG